MRRALLALVLLAACGAEAPSPAAPPAAPPSPAVSFRDAARPIASTTRGSIADLAGDWVVSQAFPGGTLAAPGSAVAVTLGTDMNAAWAFGGSGAKVPTVLVGPGRFEGPGAAPARLWVLWVDDDFRTAAIGTPDGSFGWIMDRPGQASSDRTEAARKMLEFNGYDISRLAAR